VSLALIEKEIDEVIEILLNNKGAKVNDAQKELIFDLFNTSDNVLNALVKRGNLNPELAHRITSHTANAITHDLSTSGAEITKEIVKAASHHAKERFNVEIVGSGLTTKQTQQLVENMHQNNELTHSAILRAFIKGDLEFFTYGTSMLAGIAHENTKKLSSSNDISAFEALFKAANMPTSMHQACFTLIKIVRNAKENATNEEEYYNILMDTIVTEEYDKNIPNMRYFSALINSMKATDNQQ
jgi:uncharacterized protein (DUF2336 family)